jgi:diguanylate cyclase (GGDEF)-like protein/PAS domain S-box-containing protein
MRKLRTRPAQRPAAASSADVGDQATDDRHSGDQYREIFNAVNDCILITNPVTGRFIEANRSCCEMFGYETGELTGQPVETLSSGIAPYTREAAIDLCRRAYRGEPQIFEWQCKTKNGFVFWTEVSLRLTAFGPTPAIIANVRDISERKEQQERFRQLAENIDEAFWMSNPEKTVMLYVSPGYEAIWGRSCQSLYDDPRQWIEAIHEDDRARILDVAQRQADSTYNEEYRIVRPDGEVRWIADRAFPVRDDTGRIYRVAGVARDITERKRLDAQISHMADHDALTGLPNRAAFTSTLKGALLHARRSGASLAVLFLDLDNFKDVNAVRGHFFGDQMVQLVAERLQRALRFNGSVFRVGGDQFAILLGDAIEPAEVAAVAERLIAAISCPFVIDGGAIQIGASIGVALAGDGARDPAILMSQAETALYRAKAEGRQTWRFYSAAMNAEVQSRIALTGELRAAIPAGQLRVVYQPQVRSRDGRIGGVEALVRWAHPNGGVLQPASFLPVAESSGLIVGLDRWVLREACRQGRQWMDEGRAPGVMCVNLSFAQFQQPLEFERYVMGVLEETGLPATMLELEITETTFIGFSSEHRHTIQRLRGVGIRFALDDFGTGYSSLNYLRRFSVDRIKIAREFIADVAVSRDAAAIVKCILSLARDLGNGVVAEGVETAEQLKLLQDWDCPDVQGFYFAEPMTAEAVAPLLSAGAIRPTRFS